ncbi:MAG: hypothetical protein FWD80_03960, partial [Propionibacteriaceae bacterium]|nr:hypothetical protein [Propionibacteriaceae bacterium]
MRRVTRPWVIAIVAVLVVAIVGGVWLVGSNRSGGKTSADDLMADIDATPHDPSAVGDLTTVSVADFATKLLQLVADDNNCLVSPLSLELALAMVANGAAGQTQAQILAMLAGDASMDQLNAFFSDYVAGLPNTDNVKVNIANSIWYQQGYAADVLPSFLQANATWFGASA